MLDKLEFMLAETFISLRRNTWMTFAAVTTSAMALFIIGAIAFAYISLAKFAGDVEKKFEMRVFVKESATEDDVKNLELRLNGMDGVSSVTFKTRKEVWDEFKKNNPSVTQGLEIENPMPDTFTLKFENLGKADAIAELIKKMPEVAPNDGVNYLSDEQNFVGHAMSALRWLGGVLGTVMLLTGGILIYNTIRLTILARRKEIRIMEMVGSTKAMVWAPMIMEGIVQGLIGGLLATVVLGAVYAFTLRLITIINPLSQNSPFPLGLTIFWLSFVGALYGLICSFIAIREPKKKEIPR
ncbi:MAG: permease-like cell division protein FtsX [Armatimonadetes bacterium]|nr:permease-like cell division protein FtsX [Armatimonadota bacterium]